MRKTFAAVALLAVLVGLAGCGMTGTGENDRHGTGDAPVADRDDSAASIINMPDAFPNVAVKCWRGNGIYATRATESKPVPELAVVPADPACKR
jgi:hypothetical protein